MGIAPFVAAIADYLRVQRIDTDLAAVTRGAPLALTLRTAADALVRTELRGFKWLLADTAASARARHSWIPPRSD
jgi:hypothetical protein